MAVQESGIVECSFIYRTPHGYMSSDHEGRRRRPPIDVEMVRYVVRYDICCFSKERIYVINVDDVKSYLCPYCREAGLNDVTHMCRHV